MRKNDKFLMNRLKAMYGDDFDPIMQMASNAARLQIIADQDETDPAAQIKANQEWERMAQFTTPKLKSTEITSPDGVFEVHVHRGSKE